MEGSNVSFLGFDPDISKLRNQTMEKSMLFEDSKKTLLVFNILFLVGNTSCKQSSEDNSMMTAVLTAISQPNSGAVTSAKEPAVAHTVAPGSIDSTDFDPNADVPLPVGDDDGMVTIPTSASVDATGNVYISGVTYLAGQDYKGWIKKFAPNGIEDVTNWNKEFTMGHNGGIYTAAQRVAISPTDGAIYVGGTTQPVFNSSQNHFWIKKFSSNGVENTVNWNKDFANMILNDITVGSDGTIFATVKNYNVIGGESQVLKFFSDGTEMTQNAWDGISDVFLPVSTRRTNVASKSEKIFYLIDNTTVSGVTTARVKKVDMNGAASLSWERQFSMGYQGGAQGWVYDAFSINGNLYVSSTTYLSHAVGTPQKPRVVVKKYTSTGTESWTQELNLGSLPAPTCILSDGNNGIFVSGYAADPIVGDKGWLKKFSDAGVEDSTNWDKAFAGNAYTAAKSTVVDSNGNVYVIGGTLDGDGSIKKFSNIGAEIFTQTWD